MAWLLLVLCILCISASQALFRVGALRKNETMAGGHPAPITALLLNPHTAGGVSLYIIFSLAWVLVLTQLPLRVAYPLLSLDILGVALASALVVREPMSGRQWAGIALVMAGAVLMRAV